MYLYAFLQNTFMSQAVVTNI